MKFRKKPVVIEATQWFKNGDHPAVSKYLSYDPDRHVHDWKEDGLDIHKGEYWYHCAKCGRRDWIALSGTLDQLRPAVCEPHTSRSE